jgi:hypothetical protein
MAVKIMKAGNKGFGLMTEVPTGARTNGSYRMALVVTLIATLISFGCLFLGRMIITNVRYSSFIARNIPKEAQNVRVANVSHFVFLRFSASDRTFRTYAEKLKLQRMRTEFASRMIGEGLRPRWFDVDPGLDGCWVRYEHELTIEAKFQHDECFVIQATD